MLEPLPLVFDRATAAACGYSVGQIRRRIASGDWIRLRRGVFAEVRRLGDPAADPIALDRLNQVAQIASAVVATRQRVWVGGRSGRALHHLPEAAKPDELVTLVRDSPGARPDYKDGFCILPAAVPVVHRTKVHVIPTLTAARLGADALRTEDLATALMVCDAALRGGKAGRDELEQVLRACRGWPGIVSARQRVAWVDGRRESPLESGSFAVFVEHGLPRGLSLPRSQFEVWDRGRFLGRADFGWPELRVLGEADGKSKYVDDLGGAPPPEERVWAERLRHGAFNDAGWEVARWTDHERRHSPLVVVQRVISAADRARRLGSTG
jgi:hypothetical protein